MTDALHRLIYYSRNRLEGDAGSRATDLQQILATSRVNNAAVDVTGALMFNAGCFAQVLEGPREALETTFERIQRDERHGDVSLLAFEPSPSRVFGHWSMGFVGGREDDAASYAAFAADSGFDLSRATGDQILDRLRELAAEEEMAA